VFGLETGGAGIGGPVYHWAEVNSQVVMLAMLIVPTAIATMLFCRAARKANVSWKWTLTAGSILAILGGTAAATLIRPGVAVRGAFTFGFGVTSNPSYAQMLQFAVPMTIAGWAVYRQLGARQQKLAG
jgi:hypothetical protein